MKHYFCMDIESGEEFLVSANSQGEAVLLVLEFFEKPVVLDVYTDDQAEQSGLDEY